MIEWSSIQEALLRGLPLLGILFAGILAAWLGHRFLTRRGAHAPFATQIWYLIVANGAVICGIIVAPVSEETRGQLLSLFGLALTAVLTLSSTSLVSNAMAGVMLRAVGSFRPGDFVRSEGHFGRVTERGLFHTEFQTEDRDLTTVPNLFLATNPFTVVSGSGTLVWAEVSLGYDIPRTRIEGLLCEAARAAGLEDGFVHVRELGDYSVLYRVAGFLEDAKRLLSTRSDLREQMLDTLHRAGIEIVSPTFMNQRPLDPSQVFIPKTDEVRAPTAPVTSPEDRIFDKAEEAGRLDALQQEANEIELELVDLKAQVESVEGTERYRLQRSIELRKNRLESLQSELNKTA